MTLETTQAFRVSEVSKVTIPEIDVKAIRKKLGLTQSMFALQFGLPLASVQNWEQGHRQPRGGVLLLLEMIRTHPNVVQEAAKSLLERFGEQAVEPEPEVPRAATGGA